MTGGLCAIPSTLAESRNRTRALCCTEAAKESCPGYGQNGCFWVPLVATKQANLSSTVAVLEGADGCFCAGHDETVFEEAFSDCYCLHPWSNDGEGCWNVELRESERTYNVGIAVFTCFVSFVFGWRTYKLLKRAVAERKVKHKKSKFEHGRVIILKEWVYRLTIATAMSFPVQMLAVCLIWPFAVKGRSPLLTLCTIISTQCTLFKVATLCSAITLVACFWHGMIFNPFQHPGRLVGRARRLGQGVIFLLLATLLFGALVRDLCFMVFGAPDVGRAIVTFLILYTVAYLICLGSYISFLWCKLARIMLSSTSANQVSRRRKVMRISRGVANAFASGVAWGLLENVGKRLQQRVNEKIEGGCGWLGAYCLPVQRDDFAYTPNITLVSECFKLLFFYGIFFSLLVLFDTDKKKKGTMGGAKINMSSTTNESGNKPVSNTPSAISADSAASGRDSASQIHQDSAIQTQSPPTGTRASSQTSVETQDSSTTGNMTS